MGAMATWEGVQMSLAQKQSLGQWVLTDSPPAEAGEALGAGAWHLLAQSQEVSF